MTKKEQFLSVTSYEEFDKRREEFKDLETDKDVLEHMKKIFPRVSNTKKELFKKTKK